MMQKGLAYFLLLFIVVNAQGRCVIEAFTSYMPLTNRVRGPYCKLRTEKTRLVRYLLYF